MTNIDEVIDRSLVELTDKGYLISRDRVKRIVTWSRSESWRDSDYEWMVRSERMESLETYIDRENYIRHVLGDEEYRLGDRHPGLDRYAWMIHMFT